MEKRSSIASNVTEDYIQSAMNSITQSNESIVPIAAGVFMIFGDTKSVIL